MGRLGCIISDFIHHCFVIFIIIIIIIIIIIATRFFAFVIMCLCMFLLFGSFKLDTSP